MSLWNQILHHCWGESLSYSTANTDENARSDFLAYGFWGGRMQLTFFDVRVFNPSAKSYKTIPYEAMISEKRKQSYSQTMNWITCLLSFSAIGSRIMAIRGTRRCNVDINTPLGIIVH